MKTPDWQSEDNRIQLYCGDCLEIMPETQDKSVDLVLTDPPYGIGNIWKGGSCHGWGTSRIQGITRNEWDDKPPSQNTFNEIFRVSREQIVWGGNYFTFPPSRGWLVWNKPERGFSLAEAELAWTNKDTVIRVCDCHRSDANRQHPTQKPLDLFLWCLEYFPKTETILDPFLGSGTTAIACIKTGRRCIGIEKEPKYFDLSVKRIKDELAQLNLF